MQTLKVHLSKPIASVKVLDSKPVVGDTPVSGVDAQVSGGDGGQHLREQLKNGADITSSAKAEQLKIQGSEAQKAELSQVCCTVKGIVDKLNQFYDEVFAEARGEIAKLSVEIARKILVQKVQEGDYEIESIVKEALKNVPTRQDVVVHLNPEDFVQCEKAQQEDATGTLAGIKFVTDPNIKRAECLLETPKGVVESLIDEHLEQISQALKKAE